MTQEERIISSLKLLGYKPEMMTFEDCFEQVLTDMMFLMQEIEIENKEFFKKQVNLYLQKPTN